MGIYIASMTLMAVDAFFILKEFIQLLEEHKKICLNNEFSVISELLTREEFEEKIKELSHDA